MELNFRDLGFLSHPGVESGSVKTGLADLQDFHFSSIQFEGSIIFDPQQKIRIQLHWLLYARQNGFPMGYHATRIRCYNLQHTWVCLEAGYSKIHYNSCHHFPYDIAILGIPFPDTHTFVGSHAKPRVAKLQCQAAEQRAPKECATTSKVWVFH